MILYTLACEAGHRFESWFPSSAAFDKIAADGHLACPSCGSNHVGKTIMAPAVVGGRGERVTAPKPDSEVPVDTPSAPTTDVALLDPRQQELRTLVRALHQKIVTETQDVGRRFPEEARRIHEGEEPARQIWGQATPAEARDLIEDGILILPLPTLPDEMN